MLGAERLETAFTKLFCFVLVFPQLPWAEVLLFKLRMLFLCLLPALLQAGFEDQRFKREQSRRGARCWRGCGMELRPGESEHYRGKGTEPGEKKSVHKLRGKTAAFSPKNN